MNEKFTDGKIVILDLLNREIISIPINSSMGKIDISNEIFKSTSTYICRIYSNENIIAKKSFIVIKN